MGDAFPMEESFMRYLGARFFRIVDMIGFGGWKLFYGECLRLK